jgi:hypothetical protein
MRDRDLWNLLRQAWTALGSHYEPVIETITEESGLEARGWSLLIAARTFEPDDTSVPHLMVRGPYTATEQYLNRLNAATRLGYLVEVSTGSFLLTPSGSALTDNFIEKVRAAMDSADPLSRKESKQLSDLLTRLVEKSLNTPAPPDTWAIRHSYKLMPEPNPPLPFIEQAISCLAAYRDDAHLAAWRKSGLTATAFEALTLLWRNQANSLDGIYNKLFFRGHSTQVYLDAVTELKSHNFVTGPTRILHVTEAGRSYRDQVEDDTDRYFFAPWSCLDDSEKNELESILTNLRDNLKTIGISK